jgi:hypothetical protein
MQGKNTAIWHHLSFSYKSCHLSYKILWRMVWPGTAGQPTSSSDGLRASPWYVTQNLSLATSPCHNSPTNPPRCSGPCHHYPALLTDYCIHSHRRSLYGSPDHYTECLSCANRRDQLDLQFKYPWRPPLWIGKIFLCQLGEIQVCTPSHSNSGEFQCDKDQFIERSVPANSKQKMASMSLVTTLWVSLTNQSMRLQRRLYNTLYGYTTRMNVVISLSV